MKRAFALVLAVAALVVAMSTAVFASEIVAEDEYPYTGVKQTVRVFEPQKRNSVLVENAGCMIPEEDYPYKGRKQTTR